MRSRIALAFAIIAVAVSLTAPRALGITAQANCCSPGLPPLPTPTPQQVNLAFQYNCYTLSPPCTQTGVDPGAVSDTALYWACETLDQAHASVHSNLINECNIVFAYDDAGGNGCGSKQGNPDQAYWVYANASDENAFYHQFGTGSTAPSSTTRLMLGTTQGQCNANGTAPTASPNSNQVGMLNPNDSTGTSCMYHAFADATNPCSFSGYTGPYFSVPSGEGISWDQSPLNYPNNGILSAEYGASMNYLAGTGTYAVGNAWMTDLANLMNGMCGAVCIPIIGKFEGGNGTDYCSSTATVANHCTGTTLHFAACAKDYRCNVDPWCTALGSNRNAKGWIYESIVNRNLHEGGSLGILVFAIDTQTWMMANDSTTACASGLMRFPVEETVKANYLEVVGFTWLVPDNNGIPDRFVPWLVVHTNAQGVPDANQVAHWPMYDMMPAGPEETPAPFTFNGSTVPDTASWCQNASAGSSPQGIAGDSGGVSSLVVYCPKKQEPVLCIQYQHLWIPGATDMGKVEACVNTSDTAATITDGTGGHVNYCQVDPCSTYHHILVFPKCNTTDICEGAYIPTGYTGSLLSALQNVNSGCSNTTYCLTNAGTAIQFSGDLTIGTTQVPAESTVWMTAQ